MVASENPKTKTTWKTYNVDRSQILIWTGMLEKLTEILWIGFIWLRTGTLAGCCELGNKPSHPIEVLD
jgi:hypothetical protein